MELNPEIRDYFARIGRKGGRKSRRLLSPEEAKNMVRLREARRAFQRYHSRCFWYLRDDMKITLAEVPEIVRGLRQNGGRQGFLLAARLCR